MPKDKTDRMLSLKERYTKKEIEEAIVKCNGRYAPLVSMLNCSYDQLRVWMTHHKDHFKLAESLRMALVDEAEEQISQLLNSTDSKIRLDTAKFILKTLGKTRGWGESPQVVQQINAGDEQIEIKSIFGLP